MEKITSRDGQWFYIHEIALTKGKAVYGGWLSATTDEWLPFTFYELKSDNNPQVATQDEIDRYQKRFDGISNR